MRLTTILLSKSVYIRNTPQTRFIKTQTTSKQQACCMNISFAFSISMELLKKKLICSLSIKPCFILRVLCPLVKRMMSSSIGDEPTSQNFSARHNHQSIDTANPPLLLAQVTKIQMINRVVQAMENVTDK